MLLIWVRVLPVSHHCHVLTRGGRSQGTRDSVVPYRTAARVRTYVPGAELVTIEGGGHDITISHPREVGDALLRFFRGGG